MERLTLQVAAQGNLSLLRRLIDAHDVSLARDPATGDSLLHIAAANGHAHVCAELLSRDPRCASAVNGAGATALDLPVDDGVREVLVAHSSADCLIPTPTPLVESDGDLVDSEQSEAVAANLCSLPNELAELVLFAVSGERIEPVLRLRETCRRLREVSDSDRFWERCCWNHFKVLRLSFLSGSWREVYMEHQILHESVKGASARDRDERFLDRRERAGLARGGREAVEGTIWDTRLATPSASGLANGAVRTGTDDDVARTNPV